MIIKFLGIAILATVLYNILFSLLMVIFSKNKTIDNLADDIEYKIGATIILIIIFTLIILGGAEIWTIDYHKYKYNHLNIKNKQET